MRALPLVVLLAACKPAEVCHTPAVIGDEPFFTQVTEAWGLSDVRGNTITAVDFDGDGLVDLHVATNTAHATNDFDEAQHNWLLRNTGRGFEDVTEASGITATRDGGSDRAFQTVVWGDVDNDGDLDAFTGVYRDRNADDTWPGFVHEVLLNDGDGTFTLAPPSDVGFESALAGASFVDVDGDGNLDLWLTAFYERYGALPGEQDRLLLGNGDGTFTDVTTDAGLEMADPSPGSPDWMSGLGSRPSYGATACDVDGDGDTDLLSSVYGRQPNQLWTNDGGTFTEAVDAGFSADEHLDYSDNHFYRCWCEVNGCDPDPGPASLADCDTYAGYWNPGFDDQPIRLGGNTFTTACDDVDNDGDLDLFDAQIVHWHIGGSSDPSGLLLNDGDGRFTRPDLDASGLSRPREGGWNEGDIHAAFLDVDNDGWKDVLLSSSDYPDTYSWLWRQDAPGHFVEVGETGGLRHPRNVGLAVADFDNDGDLDVVLGSSTMRSSPWSEPEVHLYRNDSGGNATRIALEGVDANARGIGAVITVEAAGIEQTLTIGGGYGHRGIQNTTTAHAGLADACNVDRITVRWPDAAGSEDVYEDVRGNYALTLTQGGGLRYGEALGR